MPPTYNVNGDLVPADEATVSVRDRGFTYGDAAFETMRAYGGDIFEWAAHADRFRRTCETLAIDHGIADSDLRERIRATLDANDFDDAYVKLSISRGVQPGKLSPGPTENPTVVVYVAELPRGGVGDGDESDDGEGSSGVGSDDGERSVPVWDGPASASVVETRRISDDAIPASAKTHNYLNGILARLELDADADADEALLLDGDGALTEGATSNLFFVADGVLKTPSLDGPVLPGITRRVVLELAEREGVPVEEGNYVPADLRAADEAFLTNSTWELRPLARVDDAELGAESGGDEFGAGPITRDLARAFDARVEREHYER